MKQRLVKSLVLTLALATHASIHANSAWYTHKTSILSSNDQAALLNPLVEALAEEELKLLNASQFFNTALLTRYDWLHQQFKQLRDCEFREVKLHTSDGETITISYFKRRTRINNTVVVVGPGFTNPAEKMAPYVHLFHHYDVAIINFRGHGRSKPFTLNPLNFLVQTFFDVNTKTRLGHHEEFDAYTVVEWLRNQQGYDNVIGMGVCYGTLIFSKAQGLHERACRAGTRSGRLFDKLILDSAWISLKHFCEKLGNDPKLIVTPQKGGWSELWPCKKGFFKNFFPALIKNAIGIQVDDRTVLPYLSDIHQAPVLFWYGKDDLTVTRNEFERIWHAAGNTHKVAVITSNPHVINHIKQKEAYALINELFIEMDQGTFLNALTDPTIIAHYLATKKHHVFDACTRSLEEPAPAQPARPAPYEQSRLQRATKIGGVGALAAGAALAAANHRHLREQLGNALKNIAGKIIPS